MEERAKRVEYANILLSFIEVAVHQLLYLRGLYPRETFERAREYGLPVHVSRHPGLSASIHAALHAAHGGVVAGTIESVVLVVLDARGAAVEAYPFDVEVSAPDDVAATYSDLDSMLSAALTRIMTLEHTHPAAVGTAAGPASAFPPPRTAAAAAAAADGRTWTLMVAAHEQLTGPRVAYGGEAAGAAAAAGGGGGKAAMPPAGAGGAASGGVLDPGSPWARVDAGDPEAALVAPTLHRPAAPSSASGGVRGTLLKSVRAGRMALQVRMLVPTASAAAL